MFTRRPRPVLLVSSIAVVCSGACHGPPSSSLDGPAGEGVVLATFPVSLNPDVPAGQEIYECWLLDARPLQGVAVHGLRWTPPTGALQLHHAMLFATSATGAPGPSPCQPMPPPVAVLPLYAPGGESTTLAAGVSLVIPASAQSLFVELHLYRREVGSASLSIDFLASATAPAHIAGWVDDVAEVPLIPPHTMATATASCRFGGPVHVVGSWPHMHGLGASFEGTIVRVDGTREPLLSVATWDASHQPLHVVDASLADGDAVETACTWNNDTDLTVQSGPFTGDEMCNQGLVVWPLESAACVR